jgi:hypothetical protein
MFSNSAAGKTMLPFLHLQVESVNLRSVRATTVLFWLLIITAERDGYIQFATVITRAILKELAR